MGRMPRLHVRGFFYCILLVAAIVTVHHMTQWVVHTKLSPSEVQGPRPVEDSAYKGLTEGTEEDQRARSGQTVTDSNKGVKETGPADAPPRPPQTDQAQNVTAEMEARRQRVVEACSALANTSYKNAVRPYVAGVFFNSDRKLAYCFVPKTGCTFWKQTFFYLNQRKKPDGSLFYQTPYDIPRLTVHTQSHPSGYPWKTYKAKLLHDYTRFMFTRDPYSRLWSAYLDKFYLPDFWLQFGRNVLKRQRPAASPRDLACGMNVSFPEFLAYALAVDEPHWAPVSKFCDPCQFKPDIIGAMETYSRDASVILGRKGLGWILEGQDHHQHVQNELEMLVAYNFNVLSKKSPQLRKLNCTSDEQLGRRLWTTFQYNGYISKDLVYQQPSPFTRESFTKNVVDAFQKSANHSYSKQNLKAQKRQFMEDAYRALPKEMLLKIMLKYETDFQMFGYAARTFE